MRKTSLRPPSYRRHKSGQAFVQIKGQEFQERGPAGHSLVHSREPLVQLLQAGGQPRRDGRGLGAWARQGKRQSRHQDAEPGFHRLSPLVIRALCPL